MLKPKKNKKKKRVLLFLLVLAVLFIIFRYWWSNPEQVQYAYANVTRGDIEKTVMSTGKLEAFKQVSVGAQVSGQVKKLAVQLGQNVKKGDLIAEIDSLTQQNELRNAEASLITAKAQLTAQQAVLAKNKLAFERQRELLAQDATSRADFEATQATYKTSQAEVLAQKANVSQQEISVDTKRLDLGYTRITAPMDGIVVAIVTKEGQTVSSIQSIPTIVVLAQMELMTVKAEISEADVTKVKAGQRVYFTVLGDPANRYDASLRTVEPAPESAFYLAGGQGMRGSSESNGAIYYNGLFDVPNPNLDLRIAMTTEVYIVQDEVKDVLIIPVQALVSANKDGSFIVRTVDNKNNLHTKSVKIGMQNNLNVQVLSGLEEGERVVIAQSQGESDEDAAMSNAEQSQRGQS